VAHPDGSGESEEGNSEFIIQNKIASDLCPFALILCYSAHLKLHCTV
jgi:hypothetical protein